MEPLGSPSFFAYEGLRLVVPGAVGYAVVRAATSTLNASDSLEEGLSAVPTAIAITLGLGLLLYFMDLPAITPFYRRQPGAEFVRELGEASGLSGYQALNRYF